MSLVPDHVTPRINESGRNAAGAGVLSLIVSARLKLYRCPVVSTGTGRIFFATFLEQFNLPRSDLAFRPRRHGSASTIRFR